MHMQQSENQIILEPFKSRAFEQMLKWIDSEKELIQFAGHLFTLPITESQVLNYLNNSKRQVYRVIFEGTVIGQAEIYLEDSLNTRLCRILIGNKTYRRQGIGTLLVNELLRISFQELKVNRVSLKVFDWNVSAIKCFEKAGMKLNKNLESYFNYKNENWKTINMSILRHEWEDSKIESKINLNKTY